MNNMVDNDQDKKNIGENPNNFASEENDKTPIGAEHEQDQTAQNPFTDSAPGINQFLKAEVNSETLENKALDSASVVQGVGHMLRKARLSKGMSVEDVSRQLRISEQQVDAIEKENFDELPGRTFVRGFVRNYANLMQLDAAAIVKMLPGPAATVTHVEHKPFKIQEMTSSSRDAKRINNALLVIIVLAFLLLAGYFLYQKMPFGQNTDEHTDVAISQEDGQTSVELQLSLPSLSLSGSSGGSAQLGSGAVSLPLQGSTSSLNMVGTLVFSFTADTHVTVTDGNGDVIFEQNNIRGTQQRVSGKRPLSIVVDDASAVELTYNDRQIDIKPYINTQNGSAQLMLE